MSSKEITSAERREAGQSMRTGQETFSSEPFKLFEQHAVHDKIDVFRSSPLAALCGVIFDLTIETDGSTECR